MRQVTSGLHQIMEDALLVAPGRPPRPRRKPKRFGRESDATTRAAQVAAQAKVKAEEEEKEARRQREVEAAAQLANKKQEAKQREEAEARARELERRRTERLAAEAAQAAQAAVSSSSVDGGRSGSPGHDYKRLGRNGGVFETQYEARVWFRAPAGVNQGQGPGSSPPKVAQRWQAAAAAALVARREGRPGFGGGSMRKGGQPAASPVPSNATTARSASASATARSGRSASSNRPGSSSPSQRGGYYSHAIGPLEC